MNRYQYKKLANVAVEPNKDSLIDRSSPRSLGCIFERCRMLPQISTSISQHILPGVSPPGLVAQEQYAPFHLVWVPNPPKQRLLFKVYYQLCLLGL